MERARHTFTHHERTKTEMTAQLQETTNAANEVCEENSFNYYDHALKVLQSARILEEERARVEILVAEIGELETQISAQRARVCFTIIEG